MNDQHSLVSFNPPTPVAWEQRLRQQAAREVKRMKRASKKTKKLRNK